MRQELSLGGNPPDEDCVQVTKGNYSAVQRQETEAYKRALIKFLGEPPEGVRFKITNNPHDFGSYYDLVVIFDDDDEAQTKYAFACESDGPATWEDAGMKVSWDRNGDDYSNFLVEDATDERAK
jgi:hypothetical protein